MRSTTNYGTAQTYKIWKEGTHFARGYRVNFYLKDKSEYILPGIARDEARPIMKTFNKGGLYDRQVNAVEQLKDVRTKGCLIRADEGTGKALEDNEPVLTTEGFKDIAQIQVGDTLYHPKGGISTVLGVYPQGMREIYKVKFSDATHVLCDYDHLWQVDCKIYNPNNKKYNTTTNKVMTTAEIDTMLDASANNKVNVPLCTAIDYPHASLPVDPYFLGILIEEFSLGESYACCTCTDPQILLKIKSELKYYGLDNELNPTTYNMKNNKLKKDLQSIGMWQVIPTQYGIPRIYLEASSQQRWDMLRGLLDTNSSIEQDGTVTYYTKSIKLRDDIAELSRSLGCLTNLSINDRGYFTVNMFISENIFTSDNQRKRFISKRTTPPRKYIVSIKKIMDAPATCIKIDRDDGLFITRAYTVTHNTRVMKALTQAHDNNVLIIAPTKSIIKQIKEEIPGVPVMSHVSLGKKAQEFNDGRTLIGDEIHHLSKAKIKEFLQWKGRIIGLTATPSHEDFDIKGFKMMLGTIHETNATSLPVDIYFTRFHTDINLNDAAKLLEGYAPDSAEKWKLILYNDEARNNKIVELTQRLVTKYRKVIVFTDRVNHADIIKERLSELLPNIFGIYGGEKYEDLYSTLAPLEEYVLVCTRHAAGEGFNVPALAAGLSCLNTSEYRVVRQMIGRVRRFAPGKDRGIRLDLYDTVSIGGGKKKYMDFPKRKKMYEELQFNVSEF